MPSSFFEVPSAEAANAVALAAVGASHLKTYKTTSLRNAQWEVAACLEVASGQWDVRHIAPGTVVMQPFLHVRGRASFP